MGSAQSTPAQAQQPAEPFSRQPVDGEVEARGASVQRSTAVSVPGRGALSSTPDDAPGVFFGSPLLSPIRPSLFQSSMSSSGQATNSVSAMLLDPPPTGQSTVLTWNHGGQDVAVAGDFDEWTARIPMSRSHDDFTTVLNLAPGKQHEFRFLVDGEWRTSPDLPTKINDQGVLVNYIEVAESCGIDDMVGSQETTAEAQYSTTPPVFQPTDAEPPMLPPHLNKIILNADTVSATDPSVLPTPHNVMLNHLYALSIRDGVMVLASTHRVRQKYVTAVLYKPVFP